MTKAQPSKRQATASQPARPMPSAEIGAMNRRIMFGANDEAFPDPATWAKIVD